MTKETRQEIRFYVLIFMSFSLLVMGFWVYPPGSITSSVLVAAGLLFSLGGLSVGIDLKEISRELRLLKRDVEEGTKPTENTENTEN